MKKEEIRDQLESGHFTEEKFSMPLLEWYDINKREMLWRDRRNPYYTWLSEIMLQQTRIEAAREYFRRFTGELPDIRSLAAVSEERLMKLWEGLGYYNRARNLKKAARILVEKYGGQLPADLDQLLELPGIGPYTAGAIASIAFGIKAPAVDGNVLRVVTRYLRWGADIGRMPVRRKTEQMLLAIMPERPGDFNQAIMELGEVICIPNGAPLCSDCPLRRCCLAREGGCQESYPKRAEKKPRRVERKSILVLEHQERIGIARRPETGLLAGLYEFPSLDGQVTQKELWRVFRERGIQASSVRGLGAAKHIFSHVEWHMRGFFVELEETEGLNLLLPDPAQEIIFTSREELQERYSLPVAFHAFLNQI